MLVHNPKTKALFFRERWLFEGGTLRFPWKKMSNNCSKTGRIVMNTKWHWDFFAFTVVDVKEIKGNSLHVDSWFQKILSVDSCEKLHGEWPKNLDHSSQIFRVIHQWSIHPSWTRSWDDITSNISPPHYNMSRVEVFWPFQKLWNQIRGEKLLDWNHSPWITARFPELMKTNNQIMWFSAAW